MARIELLQPFIKKWEGGYVNNPSDKGGETNMGVTLATWKAYCAKHGIDCIEKLDSVMVGSKTYRNVTRSLYEMTIAQWSDIMRTYWDTVKADQIANQSVANIIVDWLWGSGGGIIKKIQGLVGVVQDGKVGPATLAAINAKSQACLFDDIKSLRMAWYDAIVKRDPSQKIFLKGWQSRTNDFKFYA